VKRAAAAATNTSKKGHQLARIRPILGQKVRFFRCRGPGPRIDALRF
jgi:hypothetical protein